MSGKSLEISPYWDVILYNDDTNDAIYVTMIVQQIFRCSIHKAYDLMLGAHIMGFALCTVKPKEHAEFYSDQLHNFGLAATIKPH